MLKKLFKKTEFRVFLTIWLVYVFYLSEIGGAHSISAAALTVSIVEDHTFSIDRYKNHSDVHNFAFYKGKFYSGVAPGAPFLALPLYTLFKPLLNLFNFSGYSDSIIKLVMAVVISTVFLTAVASALTAILLFRLLKYFIKSEKKRIFLTFIFSFGTLYFLYSTRYEFIIISAFFSFFAFYLLFKVKYKELDKKTLFFAGFLSATAITFHYLQVMVYLILFLYLLSFSRINKTVFLYLLGSLIPILLLMSYHFYVFDNPFKTGYHYEYRYSGYYQHGFYKPGGTANFSSPTLKSLWGLTFSSFKGYFFYMPIMLLSLYGFLWHLPRKNMYKAEILFSFILFIFYLLFVASSAYWAAGCSYGPRYLIPTIPFMLIIIGSVIEHLSMTYVYLLSIVSVFINYLSVIYGRYCVTNNDIFNIYLPLLFNKGLSNYNPLNIVSQYFFKIPPSITSLLHFAVILSLGLLIYLIWKKNN